MLFIIKTIGILGIFLLTIGFFINGITDNADSKALSAMPIIYGLGILLLDCVLFFFWWLF